MTTTHLTQHATATRQAWLKARLELLAAEKALTRRSDELARQRQALPWVRVDKTYRFETDEGSAFAGVRNCSSITLCSGRITRLAARRAR